MHVFKDFEQAFIYCKLAAQAEIPRANTRLGYLYQCGYGVKQDYKQAIQYYQKAYAEKEVHAAFALGLMHAWGKGVPHNDKIARQYYQEAAQKGHAKAEGMLKSGDARGNLEQLLIDISNDFREI